MPREGRKMKCGWYPTTQHAMPRKRCCSTVSFSGGPSATIISGRMNGRRLCFLQFGWVVLALRLSCCPAFKLHPSSVQTRMSHRFSSRRSFVAHQSRSLDIFDRWSSPSELRASGSFEGTALGVENHGETSGRGDNVADGLIPSANGARRRWISASVRFPRFGLSKRRRRVLEEEASAPPVYRSVRETLPLLRLPVWPAQNGLIFILLDLLRLKTLATKLEDLWGGRVGVLIPKNPGESDPFVLFAHHRHSFWPLDPFRPLLRLILDEGFPAHPHRGFQTVTYVMKGGITHRDSMGLKQSYGAGEVQWMNAGRGLMHEEMWKIEDWAKTDIEIYQIWVNVPSKLKMTRPRIQLAGGNTRESPPLPVVQPSKGTEVVVIAGELCNEISPIEPMLPCSMLHVKMEAGADPWEFAIPEGSQVFIYVRRGDLTLVPTEEGYFEGEEDRGPQEIPHREAALLAFDGNFVRFENRGEAPLDFLLMEAEPTREEIAVRASFVMNTEEELDRAAADLNQGAFGRSWDHRLSDEEWRESLQGATGKRTSYGSGDWR